MSGNGRGKVPTCVAERRELPKLPLVCELWALGPWNPQESGRESVGSVREEREVRLNWSIVTFLVTTEAGLCFMFTACYRPVSDSGSCS